MARLQELAARYGLPDGAADRLRSLLELIVRDRSAPTTVRDPAAIIEEHFADSLVALELPVVRAPARIADIGAGAGFPGLPLAIALPASSISLVESNSRKCAFIARAIGACELANARVVCVRAESWPEGLASCDLVTARALAPLPVLAEYAAPLLRVGGSLIAWRGRRDLADERAGRIAAHELGLEVSDPLQVRPFEAALHRHLHLMSKVRETPDRFPRRPGMARKRPLGSR